MSAPAPRHTARESEAWDSATHVLAQSLVHSSGPIQLEAMASDPGATPHVSFPSLKGSPTPSGWLSPVKMGNFLRDAPNSRKEVTGDRNIENKLSLASLRKITCIM